MSRRAFSLLPLAALTAAAAIYRNARRHRDHAEHCLHGATERAEHAQDYLKAASALYAAAVQENVENARIAKAFLDGDYDLLRDLICLQEEHRT